MEFYVPRKLMFKAWNKESRLMMRLDNISCVRGELMKSGHIILQFTGLRDKAGEDLYEMDVVLIGPARFVIRWSEVDNGWAYQNMEGVGPPSKLTREASKGMLRLCSYFESSFDA